MKYCCSLDFFFSTKSISKECVSWVIITMPEWLLSLEESFCCNKTATRRHHSTKTLRRDLHPGKLSALKRLLRNSKAPAVVNLV